MASTDGSSIEEITYDYEVGGEKLREQVVKEVVASSALWATIAFLHRSLDSSSLDWKPLQVTIARFKRVSGVWKKQSGFNINSVLQLDKLMEILIKFKALMR